MIDRTAVFTAAVVLKCVRCNAHEEYARNFPEPVARKLVEQSHRLAELGEALREVGTLELRVLGESWTVDLGFFVRHVGQGHVIEAVEPLIGETRVTQEAVFRGAVMRLQEIGAVPVNSAYALASDRLAAELLLVFGTGTAARMEVDALRERLREGLLTLNLGV